jgi:hypothetical protein
MPPAAATPKSKVSSRAVRVLAVLGAVFAIGAGASMWIFGHNTPGPNSSTSVTVLTTKHSTTTATHVHDDGEPFRLVRSETLAGGLLCAALILLLIAMFPERPTKLTIFGNSFEWPVEKATNVLAQAVEQIYEDHPELLQDPEQLKTTLQEILESIGEPPRNATTPSGLNEIVDAAVRSTVG